LDTHLERTTGPDIDHHAILDQLPIAVAVLDPRGTVVNTNRAWRSAASTTHDRVASLAIGQALDVIRGDADRPASAVEEHLLEGILRVQAGRSERFDLHYRLPGEADEGDRWFLFNATAAQAGGSILSRLETTSQEEVHEALVDFAFHDALTNLPNRSLISDRIRMALGRTNRSGSWTVVVFADLDGFKAVNDVHGHLAGDQVLTEVARRLLTVIRSEDTCGRWGGDEFVLVLELPDLTAIDSVATRVTEAVELPIQVDGEVIQIGVSLGAAAANHLVPVDDLLRRADEAMYSSKHGGHGITVVTV